MPTPWLGPSYALNSHPASIQRTVNLEPVPIEPGNERTPWVYKDTAGLVAVTQASNIVAAFTFTSTLLVATFTDTSAIAPITWTWDFGDAGTSTTQNPTHTYATSGTYAVKLTVTNAAGRSSNVTHSITVAANAYGPAQFFLPAGLAISRGFALSNGNLTGTYGGASGTWIAARISNPTNAQVYTISDQRYLEIVLGGGTGNYCGAFIGFIDHNSFYNSYINPFGIPTYGALSCIYAGLTPGVIVNGVETNNAAYAASDGAVIGMAVNGTNGKVFFSLNGTWLGSQNPTTDANPAFTLPSLDFILFVTTHDNGSFQTPNFTARLSTDIAATLPTGYKAWAHT